MKNREKDEVFLQLRLNHGIEHTIYMGQRRKFTRFGMDTIQVCTKINKHSHILQQGDAERANIQTFHKIEGRVKKQMSRITTSISFVLFLL